MSYEQVAPFAGAWIEIPSYTLPVTMFFTSLPSRERGLKFELLELLSEVDNVAPFAGAWIEMSLVL